jgi:hypothetical protein
VSPPRGRPSDRRERYRGANSANAYREGRTGECTKRNLGRETRCRGVCDLSLTRAWRAATTTPGPPFAKGGNGAGSARVWSADALADEGDSESGRESIPYLVFFRGRGVRFVPLRGYGTRRVPTSLNRGAVSLAVPK